jgi:CDP-paratose 2-epimerase
MTSRTLITGGAGFVGTNMAARLLDQGRDVVVLDNLSRAGVRDNLRWLRETYPGVRIVEGDVRDAAAVRGALDGVDEVYHFAAQVAVTTSVTDPRQDYEVNLGGTITLLEEVRRLAAPPSLLFTSTNKVYGSLDDVGLSSADGRYEPTDAAYRQRGVSEQRPLAFCSPYGCSKGGADQYVIDYAKSYGLPTIVFRMSCIYGPHQQGNEDQGWVAHFLKQAIAEKSLTIYGDGRQVRDILYVDDLLDAMLTAIANIDGLSGQAFNMGGGPDSTISLLELLEEVEQLCGSPPQANFGAWRVGDQRWYVSDTQRFTRATGWTPRVKIAEGLRSLHAWVDPQSSGLATMERT